jgi:hypothetical protein
MAMKRPVPISGSLAYPHPEHVDRRAQAAHLQARGFAHRRAAAVGADHQVGADFDGPVRCLGAQSDDTAAVFDHALCFRLHEEVEPRVERCFVSQEVQELPLRHHRDEAAARAQPGKIGDHRFLAPDDHTHIAGLVVRALQERIEQP